MTELNTGPTHFRLFDTTRHWPYIDIFLLRSEDEEKKWFR